jgi:hypothetical protein
VRRLAHQADPGDAEGVAVNLTIYPTTKVVELTNRDAGTGAIPARIWEGTTESGIRVHLIIARVAVPLDADPEVHARFAAELSRMATPSADVEAYPMRLIL